MAFNRTEEYMTRIVLDALDRDVRCDAEIQIISLNGKLKAYCKETGTYIQFPRAIRRLGKVFIADVIKSSTNGTPFYRAYKGSIRENDGRVVA